MRSARDIVGDQLPRFGTGIRPRELEQVVEDGGVVVARRQPGYERRVVAAENDTVYTRGRSRRGWEREEGKLRDGWMDDK